MEKEKIKLHEFPLGIYPRRIWIANRCSAKELAATFNSRNGDELDFNEEEGNESVALVFPMVALKENGNYGILIWLKSKLSTGHIAHEAGHVATEIFMEIGRYLDPKNQEPFMYLLGYIADCIDKVQKNKFDD